MKKKLTGNNLTNARTAAKKFLGVYVDISNPNKPFKSIWRDPTPYCKQEHLGYFQNAESAALAYNKKAKNYFLTARAARKANRWNVIKNN